MASLTEANSVRTTRIRRIVIESPTTKTFVLKDEICKGAKPGQFIMLWIPRVDEIPLSIMDVTVDQVSVTVKAVGEATKALHKLKVGAYVGVRGPFGNYFTESKGRVLMVGGGTGIAPLLFLARKIAPVAESIDFVVGAKTRDELLFLEDIVQLCTKERALFTTDDGTYGLKCFATDPLEGMIAKKKFDVIYTCGPERMARKVFDLADRYGIPSEASLERIMRCGMGLCGICVVGKYRTCRDGPVFESGKLREIDEEFGISKLDFDGRRIPV